MPNPPGFSSPPPPSSPARLLACCAPSSSSSSSSQSPHQDPLSTLKLKKAWELATTPAKSIPMNAFMLWMAGSSVQIFSILITAMMLYQPLKAVVSMNQVFAPYGSGNDKEMVKVKMVFVVCQLAVIGMGVWKCQQMGLLPTATSDWLAFMATKQATEIAF